MAIISNAADQAVCSLTGSALAECGGLQYADKTSGHQEVLQRFLRLYEDLLSHDGYGEIRVDVKILKRGQKEVVLHCGKQYRYVVDYSNRKSLHTDIWQAVEDAREGSEKERRQHQSPIGFLDRRITRRKDDGKAERAK